MRTRTQIPGLTQLSPVRRRPKDYLRYRMAQLRRKLEDNPARPLYLLTEPGMGYRYQPL